MGACGCCISGGSNGGFVDLDGGPCVLYMFGILAFDGVTWPLSRWSGKY